MDRSAGVPFNSRALDHARFPRYRSRPLAFRRPAARRPSFARSAGTRPDVSIDLRHRCGGAIDHRCVRTGACAWRRVAGGIRRYDARRRRMHQLVHARRPRAGNVGRVLGPVSMRRRLGMHSRELRASPRRRAARARARSAHGHTSRCRTRAARLVRRRVRRRVRRTRSRCDDAAQLRAVGRYATGVCARRAAADDDRASAMRCRARCRLCPRRHVRSTACAYSTSRAFLRDRSAVACWPHSART